MTDIVYSMVGDTPRLWQGLLRDFNRQHRGNIRVRLRFVDWNVADYLTELREMFEGGGSDIDVIVGDVIWPAEFADNGWIEDLSDRFAETDAFLPGPMQANTYDDKVWGVPLYSDVGLLYYRKDLLDLSGFFGPPQTWDQLKRIALQVKQDSGIQYGYVFPGAEDDSGVYNGLEYIWTHGGDVLDPKTPPRVIIDSPETVEGLTTERSMITAGVSPQDVASYSHLDPGYDFLRGRSVFCRSWPWLLPAVGPGSALRLPQVELAPIPAGVGGQSAGCLGGWNLFINAASDADRQDAAWQFIQFMTDDVNQKNLAIMAQLMPTRKALYEDPDVLQVPIIPRAKAALDNARARPTIGATRRYPPRWPSSLTAALRAKSPRLRPPRRYRRA
jgi:multiple sugar transport system substrate-binding protein